MSTFDEIHDKFIPKPTIRKKGTKYERLVSIVVATLDQDRTVTHDVKMRGDSDVLRQIDVRISRNGSDKRILVECKDFDESGDKVDLEIVDRFIAVVHDLKPDEAWIVTCNGFTRDALKIAKHAGIKLVVLRKFNEDDWNGRVRQININLTLKTDLNHQLKFITHPNDTEAFERDVMAFGSAQRFRVGGSGMTLTTNDGKSVDVAAWLEEQRKHFDVLHSDEGHYEAEFALADATVTLDGFGTYRIRGIVAEYDVSAHLHELVVDAGSKIATLLLKGVGSGDIVVWDEDLKKFDIDDDGEVVQR